VTDRPPGGPGEARGCAAAARRLLEPGGEVALIEFRKLDGSPGPPKEVRLSEEEVAAAAGAAGLRVREQRGLNEHLVLYHLAAT
jgi:hypothetical protein